MKIYFILLLSLSIYSCAEKTQLNIQNKVHNVKLENIGFEDISIYSSLLTGETGVREIWEDKSRFPKRSQVKFYMVKGTSKVYLKTKQYYVLDYKQVINIVISDTTEVINP